MAVHKERPMPIREGDDRESRIINQDNLDGGWKQNRRHSARCQDQGCQMVKFDPFLSLDCARVEGVGAQSKERKGSNFTA